jgi:hypothetical protein
MVMIIVIVIILMSTFEFKDKGIIKLIVGVMKHVSNKKLQKNNELRPVDYQGSNHQLL